MKKCGVCNKRIWPWQRWIWSGEPWDLSTLKVGYVSVRSYPVHKGCVVK